MPDFILQPFSGGVGVNPLQVLVRLLFALALGGLVALIYRHSRPADEVAPSFSVTLVLLTILIAMVTQVIGDSIARAFSLVGALSIVRFRTVVRDTQDTAYVIFAVVVGMAVGASDPWVALVGIGVVASAAAIMRNRAAPLPAMRLPYLLHVRLALGHDANEVLGPILGAHAMTYRLVSLATARQGLSLDISYRAALKSADSATDLVKAINQLDGIQSVAIQRADDED